MGRLAQTARAVADAGAQLPAGADDDVAYVEANFGPMLASTRPLVEQGILPRATYVLPDGTPMVPADHARLLDDAGGDPGTVAGHFRERYLAAGGESARVDEEHRAWLSGEYGACLHDTSPESIVAKDSLISAIEALLAGASPDDPKWCDALGGAVDALDALERAFAEYDRARFGAPTSRDRLIAGPRERYPAVWERAVTGRGPRRRSVPVPDSVSRR